MLLNNWVVELHLKHLKKALIYELDFFVFKINDRFCEVLKYAGKLLLSTTQEVVLLQNFRDTRWIETEKAYHYCEASEYLYKKERSFFKIKVLTPVWRAMEGNSANNHLEEDLNGNENIVAPLVGKVKLLSHHEQAWDNH